MTNTRTPVSWINPQVRHDQALRVPKPDQIASKAKLEVSLRLKNGPSGEPSLPGKSSPIEQETNRHSNGHDAVVMVRLMQNNPSRTFEDVKKMASEAGLLGYDPIAQAMKDNPGLTREKAEEMAEAFGF